MSGWLAGIADIIPGLESSPAPAADAEAPAPSFFGLGAAPGQAPAAAAPAPNDDDEKKEGNSPLKTGLRLRQNFARARSMTTVLTQIAVDEVSDASKSEPGAKQSSNYVPPPPIRMSQRPLRRRQGPEWACVEVLRENDEKGPCESTVLCRFCGEEFMADTARVREHVVNGGTAAGGEALPPPMSPTSPTTGAPPVPPCPADLTPESGKDREVALQWLRDYDMLQFCIRMGIAVTPQVAKVRRRAESAEARAVLYPSKEHAALAAAAAGEAAAIMTQAGIDEWSTTDKLHFVGCGLQDDDCFKAIDLLKRAGSLRELRSFSLAQNGITDVGFEALCRHAITPPTKIALAKESDAGSENTQSVLDDQVARSMNRNSSDPELEGSSMEPSLLGLRLLTFSSFGNPIGDRGIAALARALDAGGLPNLQALNLSGSALINPDGSPRKFRNTDRGVTRGLVAKDDVSSAVGTSSNNSTRAPKHVGVNVANHGIGDAGIKELAYRIHHNKPTPGKPGMLTNLKDLRLFSNSIGDEGLISLAMAFSERPKLCRNIGAWAILGSAHPFRPDCFPCFCVPQRASGCRTTSSETRASASWSTLSSMVAWSTSAASYSLKTASPRLE